MEDYMNKKRLSDGLKKNKNVEEMIKEFLKRSKELEIQEENFRLKVLANYNKI
jgi:multimeric flavodoxin WrbA